MPSCGTADLGLFFGRIPHRSSVRLTPGNSVQFSSRSGDTWKMVSVAFGGQRDLQRVGEGGVAGCAKVGRMKYVLQNRQAQRRLDP